jgi:hypothetical protein
MKPSIRLPGLLAAGTAVAILSAAAVAPPFRVASAQQPPAMPQHHQQMMQGKMPGNMHGNMPGHAPGQSPGQTPGDMGATLPTLPGQDAFGAIQEIVRLLEADPATDWSKINLEALRQHLIDMNDVTLKADAVQKPVDGGLEIAVTGSGRTLAAIQRMVPAHARELDKIKGWSAKATPLPDGVLLTVTSGDAKEIQHIRGLGFIGLLVSGGHHQPHHLAMAKGEFTHRH